MSGEQLGHQIKSTEILVYTLEATLQPNFDETWSECLSWHYLGQVQIWIMLGQKLGHQVKSYEILVFSLEATFATRFLMKLGQNVCLDNI